MRKTYLSYSLSTFNNVAGYSIEYRPILEVYDDAPTAGFNPRYGSAMLTSPITFTDDVSQISPNARPRVRQFGISQTPRQLPLTSARNTRAI